MTKPSPDATVLSTSQPERMDDPFNRKQVEAVCRAVCMVEGVDPDSDVYGDGCDPQWSRYADAVAAALAATPAVGGEATVDAVRQTIADEWGSHLCYHSGDYHSRVCDKDKQCRCMDIARAILSAHSLAAQPASPLRGREMADKLQRAADRAGREWGYWQLVTDAAALLRSASPPEQPAAPPSERKTLWGQINAVYGNLDAEDGAWIDREWMLCRGIAAQPVSPLRGRDIEEALERFAQRADILPKTARDDTTVHFRLRDCRAARAALSASPPEQPAAVRSIYCAHCEHEHQLHEDAQGFHHVIRGERVPCCSVSMATQNRNVSK